MRKFFSVPGSKSIFALLLAMAVIVCSMCCISVFADDADEHDHDKELLIQVIPWAVVGGIVVIGVVVLLIKCPEKIAKGLRVYKSEFKKVSWLSWKDTRKSSLVVLGVLVACALVICLLDLGLYKGLLALIQALRGLFA